MIRRVRERVYSLLLLMVMIVSGGGVLLHTHCSCSADEHKEHHHICNHTDECEAHSHAITHRCVIEEESSFEYVVVNSQRIQNLYSAISMQEQYSTHQVPSLDTHTLSNVLSRETVYRGYDPSVGALRAPPVLI